MLIDKYYLYKYVVNLVMYIFIIFKIFIFEMIYIFLVKIIWRRVKI